MGIDAFTRQAPTVEVEHRRGATFAIQTLQRLLVPHGVPPFVRLDNGPAFIAEALVRFLAQVRLAEAFAGTYGCRVVAI